MMRHPDVLHYESYDLVRPEDGRLTSFCYLPASPVLDRTLDLNSDLMIMDHPLGKSTSALSDKDDHTASYLEHFAGTYQPAVKLDKHGLPLTPQPSDHKDDPLVSRQS